MNTPLRVTDEPTEMWRHHETNCRCELCRLELGERIRLIEGCNLSVDELIEMVAVSSLEGGRK